MSLDIGTKVGSYEVIGSLGVGGMGEVYRARDSKLNRDVALKTIPDLFANDAERLARFRREAQVLASLNHPHIGHIYGFEESTTPHVCALVLELVEGEDLSQRLARGPIPLDDAIPIARQIAEALEAAHEQGVIHRDLKPANIKVRDDGTVKVLDFGLAKAFATESTTGSVETLNSPTLTAHATLAGVILGTAAYMAPEQAKGKAVDRRADIWAFGAVLYEMMSGERAFKGEDISDTLAAVLRQEIDWSALPAKTPAVLRHLIARCLERDPRKRLRDIGEARIVLDDPTIANEPTEPSATPTLATAPLRPFWRRTIPIAATAIVSSALVASAVWNFRPVLTPAVTRFSIALAEGQAFSGTSRRVLALSRDGTHMVYVANPGRLYLRSMAEMEARPIRGSENLVVIYEPVFSPDGQFVAFHTASDNTIKSIAIAGGTPVTICRVDAPSGMTWSPEGIFFSLAGTGIMKVSANGGTPETVVAVGKDESAQRPQILPDGEHVLFALAAGTADNRWDRADIVAHSLKTGARRVLIKGGSDARYLPTGHLVYAVGGTLFAVPFDADRLTVTGGPVSVVEGVRRANTDISGLAQFSVSENGSLAYVPGPIGSSGNQFTLVLAERKGSVTELKISAGSFATPRASPDGRRVALTLGDARESNIWIGDLSGAIAMQRVTFGGSNRYPIWTADSRRIAFQSNREGDLAIFWQAADGSGSAERLTKPDRDTEHIPESWSPKIDTLLFTERKVAAGSLWAFSLKDRKATAFGEVRSSNPIDAVFSPDGRWVAYASTHGTTTKVYVQPFPPTGATYELFAPVGESPHHPIWSPDGRELIYNPRPGALEAVTFTADPQVSFGNPRAWPRPFETGPPSRRRPFDILPDGRLLGLTVPGAGGDQGITLQRIHVVLNWFEELKQRVR